MKISTKIVSKFQEGGAMPPEAQAAQGAAPAPAEGAPAQGGEQDPIMQLAEMAMQALQSQDCQMMAAVCEGFISLTQGAGGGAPAQESAPVYKKGGILVKRVKN